MARKRREETLEDIHKSCQVHTSRLQATNNNISKNKRIQLNFQHYPEEPLDLFSLLELDFPEGPFNLANFETPQNEMEKRRPSGNNSNLETPASSDEASNAVDLSDFDWCEMFNTDVSSMLNMNFDSPSTGGVGADMSQQKCIYSRVGIPEASEIPIQADVEADNPWNRGDGGIPNEMKLPVDDMGTFWLNTNSEFEQALPFGGGHTFLPPKIENDHSYEQQTSNSNMQSTSSNTTVLVQQPFDDLITLDNSLLISNQAFVPSPGQAETPTSFVGVKVKRRATDKVDTSESDSDEDDDDDSDEDCGENLSANDPESKAELQRFASDYINPAKKQKPYFYQYNYQSRGPKGMRLCPEIQLKDPHQLDEYVDPVETKSSQSKWGEKIRKGEGNDPRPNARKLLEIGSRIHKLEKEFKDLSVKGNGKGKDVNKSKNQLASRICRLKKKAQHESNKLKLEGLRKEHQQLMSVIKDVIKVFVENISLSPASSSSQFPTTFSAVTVASKLCPHMDTIIRQHLGFQIAGNTTDYVNMELEKVAKQILEQ